MSLFGSLLSGFDDDAIFGGHRNLMNQMLLHGSLLRDPFQDDEFFTPTAPPAASRRGGVPALTGGAGQGAAGRGPFSLALPGLSGIMSSMDQMAQNGNCHMFSSSSVMTMTTGPDGKPQVYQATSSTTGVPGGVRETRQTVSDSRTGTRKMAIGHHIGQRSHIIEREHSKNNMEERQEFINLDEEEAPQFDREFRHRTQGMSGRGNTLEYRRPRHTSPQTPYNPRPHNNTPAIQYSPSPSNRDERARRRDREERGHRSHRRYQPTM